MSWRDIVAKTAHIKTNTSDIQNKLKSNNDSQSTNINIKNDESEKLPCGKFKITSKHSQTILNLRTSLKLKQTDIDHMFSLPKNTCNSIEKGNIIIDEKIYNKVLQGLNKKVTNL